MKVVAGRGSSGGFRWRGLVGGYVMGHVEVMGCVVVWIDFNRCDFGGQLHGQWMQQHGSGGAATWAVGFAGMLIKPHFHKCRHGISFKEHLASSSGKEDCEIECRDKRMDSGHQIPL
nr:hypothetical protein CFP56_30407 [Quercus suber]